MILKSGLHRGRHLQSRVYPAEVVERELQSERGNVILKLLTVGVRQTGHAAILHSDIQILAFNVRRADFAGVGVSATRDFRRANHFAGAVSVSMVLRGVFLDEHGEVRLRDHRRDRFGVASESVGRDLESARRRVRQLPSELGSVLRITTADVPS